MKKGDMLAVAQVAGIMGAKKNYELIPMCHPLQISIIDITFKISDKNIFEIFDNNKKYTEPLVFYKR